MVKEQKRLYRSSRDSVIAGICGGLGDYFNTDPLLFRLLFVLAVIFGGSGILVYIVLWIVIPYEPNPPVNESTSNNTTMNDENKQDEIKQPGKEIREEEKRNYGNLWAGLILITLGAIFLIDRFVPRIDFGDMWPVILIVIGIILITKTYQKPKS